ncbi:hypothetical protein SRHO_G00253250 [Serrasalmus rhombeus]
MAPQATGTLAALKANEDPVAAVVEETVVTVNGTTRTTAVQASDQALEHVFVDEQLVGPAGRSSTMLSTKNR